MSDSAETKQCTNCMIDILSSNYLVHSVHCQRNFYLCVLCHQPVNKNNKIEHEEGYHTTINCKNCQLPLQKWSLNNHLVQDCPYRKVKCQICDIEIEERDIIEHEDYCGSRTEKCLDCGEFVMIKYKSLHIESNHAFIKLSDEPPPSPAWQYGRRTLSNFIPELTSNNYKSLSSHKKKLSKKRKLKNLSGKADGEEKAGKTENEPKEMSSKWNTNFFCLSPSEEQNIGKMEAQGNYFRVKKTNKPYTKDTEDLTFLSSFASLQISNERPKNLNYSRQSRREESDFMYAIKVAQELNSHLWKQESETRPDSSLKNPVKIDNRKGTSDIKAMNKNIDSGGHEEEIKLACEFCGVLIPLDDLVSHQNACDVNMKETFKETVMKDNSVLSTEKNEIKLPCEICNKLFSFSQFENHQIYCNQNLMKFWEGHDKKNCVKSLNSLKYQDIKSDKEQNAFQGTIPKTGNHSELLTEQTKFSKEKEKELKINLNQPEETKEASKAAKLSRKNRRAPSPPKM